MFIIVFIVYNLCTEHGYHDTDMDDYISGGGSSGGGYSSSLSGDRRLAIYNRKRQSLRSIIQRERRLSRLKWDSGKSVS